MGVLDAARNGKQQTLRQMQQRRTKDAYGESGEGYGVLMLVVPQSAWGKFAYNKVSLILLGAWEV
jgi:hypothetical protein